MTSPENTKKRNHLKLLLFGASIGAVLGMLFAPAKGSETRDKLRGLWSDLFDNSWEEQNEGNSNQENDPESDHPV